MEWAKEFLEAYRYLVYSALLVLLSVFIIIRWWDNIKFWWMCTWMSFPIIGFIATKSKEPTTKKIGQTEWYSSEVTLCSKFYNYYLKYKKDTDYTKAKNYLEKAQELSRKPLTSFEKILISVLLIVEAFGIGYIIAQYANKGGSEFTQQWWAFLIGLALAAGLGILNHKTGEEWYKNEIIDKINDWNDSGASPKPLTGAGTIENTYSDDDKPAYLQLYNRVNENIDTRKKTTFLKISILSIILLGVFATWARYDTFQMMQSAEVANSETTYYGSSFPQELRKPQKDADSKAISDTADFERSGALKTFILMAFIFILIQLIGILFGKFRGFMGTESEKAYKIIKTFSTSTELEEYYEAKREYVQNIAQQKLEWLQQSIKENLSNSLNSGKQLNDNDRTFLNYVHLKSDESMLHDYNDSVSKRKHADALNRVDSQTPTTFQEDSSEKKCINCNFILDKETKFCSNCGTLTQQKLKVPTCPQCGKRYEVGMKFCKEDGTLLELV